MQVHLVSAYKEVSSAMPPDRPLTVLSGFNFELSSGILYAEQDCIDQVEDSEAPRNLIQLHALGMLLVNHTIAQADETSTDTEAAVPLLKLLTSQRYGHIATTAYARLDVSDWDEADYLDYGQWLHNLTSDPEQAKSQLSQQVLLRANRIGIGPSYHSITHQEAFPTLTAYYHALDILPGREKYKYDKWSDQDLADYAERVFLELLDSTEERINPKLNEEINRRAKLGLGPPVWIYKRYGKGGVAKFMAMNGYADANNMEPEDYVQLGVRFMLANGGRLPTAKAIDFLSRSRRTPNPLTFARKFVWSNYLDQVQSAYTDKVEADSDARAIQALKQKLPAIKEELENGILPSFIVKNVPAREVVSRRAKWLLLSELFPGLTAPQKQLIVQRVDASKLKATIRRIGRSDVSSRDIKAAADKQGVTEDLWPPKSEQEPYMRYLKVPKELLVE